MCARVYVYIFQIEKKKRNRSSFSFCLFTKIFSWAWENFWACTADVVKLSYSGKIQPVDGISLAY